jgi:hypothetical protein
MVINGAMIELWHVLFSKLCRFCALLVMDPQKRPVWYFTVTSLNVTRVIAQCSSRHSNSEHFLGGIWLRGMWVIKHDQSAISLSYM